MALLGSVARPQIVFKPDRPSPALRHQHKLGTGRRLVFSFRCLNTGLSGGRVFEMLRNQCGDLSSNGGLRIVYKMSNERQSASKKRSGICSCWMAGSQLASSAFTLGTAAVLPFYSLMVFAPRSQITKKAMDSNVPYVSLGLLYAYLLYLSWTPDTIRLMFASEYWLPELPGIARLFSSETTLASAWIHLLVIDLFAARHIYRDGLDNEVETRHSVSLCLLVCPIGILAHTITKALTRTAVKSSKHNV